MPGRCLHLPMHGIPGIVARSAVLLRCRSIKSIMMARGCRSMPLFLCRVLFALRRRRFPAGAFQRKHEETDVSTSEARPRAYNERPSLCEPASARTPQPKEKTLRLNYTKCLFCTHGRKHLRPSGALAPAERGPRSWPFREKANYTKPDILY